MLNIAVLASGSGTNLQSIIDSIERGDVQAEISLVLSDNPQAFALDRAKKHGIPVEIITEKNYPKREDYGTKLADTLKASNVELVILAGFMRILTPIFIQAFSGRIMNIHPSLLPSFPGLDVHRKAIEHGAKFSGATVHFVDEGVDTGPIIMQAVVPIMADDTPDTLAKRILAQEHRIYPQAIKLFSEGRLSVEGRRVVVKNAKAASGTLENPPLTVTRNE